MTTGRIDYAPDYKSEKPPQRIWGDTEEGYQARVKAWRESAKARMVQHGQNADREAKAAERQRLRDAVVDLAIKTRRKGVSANCPAEECKAYYAAVDALLEFESKLEPKK